jgi:hypothetical protein
MLFSQQTWLCFIFSQYKYCDLHCLAQQYSWSNVTTTYIFSVTNTLSNLYTFSVTNTLSNLHAAKHQKEVPATSFSVALCQSPLLFSASSLPGSAVADSLVPRPSSCGKNKGEEGLGRTYQLTEVTDCGQFWERGWTPTHSEHANTGLPKLLHLLHTQGGQLTSAAVQLLLQGANLVHHLSPNAPNEQQCKLRWVWFCLCLRSMKSFYLLSTLWRKSRDKFDPRPSSRLTFCGGG